VISHPLRLVCNAVNVAHVMGRESAVRITKLFETNMLCAALALSAMALAAPMPALAQAAPGTVAYPSCDPGAAPLNNAIKADWQAYCAKKAQAAAPATPSATIYAYCNPEAAPADANARADWQANCAAQQQQQQQQTQGAAP
jgi:hypothetical protein